MYEQFKDVNMHVHIHLYFYTRTYIHTSHTYIDIFIYASVDIINVHPFQFNKGLIEHRSLFIILKYDHAWYNACVTIPINIYIYIYNIIREHIKVHMHACSSWSNTSIQRVCRSIRNIPRPHVHQISCMNAEGLNYMSNYLFSMEPTRCSVHICTYKIKDPGSQSQQQIDV